MTKNELMEMARNAGFMFHDAGYAPMLHTLPKEYSDKCFDRLFNAILERAAVEFDNRGKYKDGSWSTGSYDPDSPGIILREMKLPTN